MAVSRKIAEDTNSDRILQEEPGVSLDNREMQHLDKAALVASLDVALRGFRINSEVL